MHMWFQQPSVDPAIRGTTAAEAVVNRRLCGWLFIGERPEEGQVCFSDTTLRVIYHILSFSDLVDSKHPLCGSALVDLLLTSFFLPFLTLHTLVRLECLARINNGPADGESRAECNNVTTTLRNAADIAAIATCATYTGNIVYATDAPAAELLGVEQVIGSVIVANNSVMTTVAADKLQSVSNSMVLDTLPLLTNITLPMWSSVNTVILNRIPPPTTLNMQTHVQKVTNLYITDTTLETLFGLLLQTSQMENLQITGNKFLQNCWFGVGNITQQATIVDNSGQMMLTLPNLTYAYNMEITNASSVEMPVLQSVNQHLDVSWNAVQKLSLPELSYVGGDFGVNNNGQLAELDLPMLVNVQGNMDVTGNNQLQELSGLSALAYVGGNLTVEGEFDDVKLKSLTSVGHDLTLNIEDGSADCSDLPMSLAKSGVYTCRGSKHSHGHIGPGVIAGIVIAAVFGTALFCAAVAWHLIRRRGVGVREIATSTANDSERPPLPPKEQRSSYGYYDIKAAEQVVDAGRVKHEDVALQDLKAARERERESAVELPTEVNSEVREMITSPTGAAHELESPDERARDER
ncbi:cell wall protein Ecm33 [Teratosphaeriaceae sp. CCFEE 6253]|nr:cell wall protein Ecm33 [Teratosphaeriaceae sp. CCFEE 6253]